MRIGQRVDLVSMSSDPDVFIFDSRYRLIDYAAGRLGRVKDITAHAVLVEPGTQAIVAMCGPSSVKPTWSNTIYDAVGIKITSGRFRSRWGWVSSEDLRV